MYHKILDGKTCYFDVDDTLIMWDIPEDYSGPFVEIECRGKKEWVVPHWRNLAYLIKFSNRGYSIIVWSAGGADWADACVRALGVEKHVDVVLSKPTYYFDDMECHKFMGVQKNMPFEHLDDEITEYLSNNGVLDEIIGTE